jgi:hypothetical protein
MILPFLFSINKYFLFFLNIVMDLPLNMFSFPVHFYVLCITVDKEIILEVGQRTGSKSCHSQINAYSFFAASSGKKTPL